MPKQVIHPDDLPDLPDQVKKWLVAQGINIFSKSPIGSLVLLRHEISSYIWDKYGIKPIYPGHGLFFDPEHPNWAQRLGAPLAASPTRTTPPKSGGKREAPSKKGSQRASGDAKHRRAYKCPKGHYWSYKLGKCVKSKFR